MAKIEIYTKATCPYCHRAKALLNSKGAAFEEIAIDGDADKREKDDRAYWRSFYRSSDFYRRTAHWWLRRFTCT